MIYFQTNCFTFLTDFEWSKKENHVLMNFSGFFLRIIIWKGASLFNDGGGGGGGSYCYFGIQKGIERILLQEFESAGI